MNKKLLVACILLVSALSSGTALADSIKGRLAVTGLIGFQVPADSEIVSGPPVGLRKNLDTDTGFAIGGGLLYGLEKNIALEFQVAHTDFDALVAGFKQGNIDTNTYSLGIQYRFDTQQQRLTPYIGAGFDIFSTDMTRIDGVKADVDTSFGVHISGGLDYFVTKQVALTGELRMTVAPDSDIKFGGIKWGSYDPMGVSMGFGARFFFN